MHIQQQSTRPETKQDPEGPTAVVGGNMYPVVNENALLNSFNQQQQPPIMMNPYYYYNNQPTHITPMPSSSSYVYQTNPYVKASAPIMFDPYHQYYMVPNPYHQHMNQFPSNASTTTCTTTLIENPNVPKKNEEEKPYFVHTLNKHTDTLTKLALRFNCTEEDIKMLNNLLCDDLDLYEHDTILIPKREVQFIKENYDLEETKRATERQRSLMVSNFAKLHKVSIDEARTYLEMHDWKSKEAREELLKDQAWEKQTMGKVLSPSHFASSTSSTRATTTSSQRGHSTNSTTTRRAPPRNSNYANYSYEMADMK
ncbi:hypothetical protein C9374_007210 [Naegleria lovaniensis]|uniref:LysM domain-containing protein n=1 Tax=Naegleria lovaniensis TaxID=51637 RepID=A0AA88H526_NAELO|nr:uncharacterized protein C9374_007210 [Naegleria lovaniensis]KAG2393679.1 hypothetical protein C9374_007210 [Naegleria lovaniensis]